LPSAVSATGTISSFTGPAGATYTINDSSASFGSIAPGATVDCQAATANCYRITVSNPAVRPSKHWDATIQETLSTGNVATMTVHMGRSFADVQVSDAFYDFIETMLHNQVTAGFANGTFGPSATSIRVQSMMFAARGMVAPEGDSPIPASGAIAGSPYNCASGGTSRYADVAPTDIGCKHIHFLGSKGVNVSFGCTASNACPAAGTTRAMMAVYVAAAATGDDASVPPSGTFTQSGSPRSYNCSAGGSSHFPDVSVTSAYCRHVNYLWATGSVDGFVDGTFQPSALVTRAQMAKFMTNTFVLTLD
jgi:hypothetical protein